MTRAAGRLGRPKVRVGLRAHPPPKCICAQASPGPQEAFHSRGRLGEEIQPLAPVPRSLPGRFRPHSGLLRPQHRSGRPGLGGESQSAPSPLRQVRSSATPTPALRPLGGSNGRGHNGHLGVHPPRPRRGCGPGLGSPESRRGVGCSGDAAPSLGLLLALSGREGGCTRGPRALTFVPLHGASACAPAARLGRSAPRARSPPGAPRSPLPVMSRSRPNLPARLPLPAPSDPVRARPAAPAGELRGRPGRTFRAQVRPHRAPSPPLAGSAFPARPLGRWVGTRPRRAHTRGEAPGRGRHGRAYGSCSSQRRAADPLPGGGD